MMTIVNMEILPLPWKFRWNTTPWKSAASKVFRILLFQNNPKEIVVAIYALVRQFFVPIGVIVYTNLHCRFYSQVNQDESGIKQMDKLENEKHPRNV